MGPIPAVVSDPSFIRRGYTICSTHPAPPIKFSQMIASDPDIKFSEVAGGFEVHYSKRLGTDYRDLVNESADWLENQLGVFNLGQIDHEILLADGVLTEEIKSGLIGWWSGKVTDLQLG